MLDDIRLHIHSDEDQQSEVERLQAESLQSQFSQNKRTFLRYAAGLRPLLEKAKWQNYGIFYNKHGDANIVDRLSGTAIYGRSPSAEITRQTNTFLHKPVVVALNSSKSKKVQQLDSCLVILGIGLGYHLQSLIENTRHKYIIIYEPELQFFLGSCFFFNWEKALKLAEEKGVTLFFQVGETGEKIKSDLSELRSHFRLESFSVYQHYNNPIFLSIVDHAKYYSDQRFFEYAIEWSRGETWAKYLPLWTPPTEIPFSTVLSHQAKNRFNNNIKVFSNSFPEIANEFKKYTPNRWQPIEAESGEITLQHIGTGAVFCAENPVGAGKDNYTNFTQYPNKDGLVLGYNGIKLLPYLHYQFVKEAGELIDQLEDEKSTLPETLKSMILFGLVNGYHLAELVQNHTIEALLICEPEPDFFYASLFSIDFESIIAQFNKRQARLYFNIGDDGSNLYVDLMHQFHAIGPYVLQDTYFYQAYSRKDFAQSIASLREQLQVVVSAGEYFDHVRYGIEHTRRVLKDGCHIQKCSDDIQYPEGFDETPVFVIGNGPSLDRELDYIKSVQDKVIIVSCGTTIKSLAKNNIRPDIHVEIEQNRSTYDWLVRADCAELLSETTLLSCNGIHPDVVALFKDVLICLKNGESSTEVAELSLGKDAFEKLEHAYPTVTNLALNAIVKLRFKNVYLFGVDLAFLSETEHHSKDSGYYDDKGKEIYRYSESKDNEIIVPGNFGGFLKTKYEFKLSKNCLESLMKAEGFSCINCSYGARIEGTVPSRASDVFLQNKTLDKAKFLHALKLNGFERSNKALLERLPSLDILENFPIEQVQDDIELLEHLVGELECENISLGKFIQLQKEALVGFYNNKTSMSFYLLYVSSNYVLSVFSKFEGANRHRSFINILIRNWKNFLGQIKEEFIGFPNTCDFISSLGHLREKVVASTLNESFDVFVNKNETYQNKIGKMFHQFKPNNMNFHFGGKAGWEYKYGVFLICDYEDYEDCIVTLKKIHSIINVTLLDSNAHFFKKLIKLFPRINFNLLVCPEAIYDKSEIIMARDGKSSFHLEGSSIELIPKLITQNFSNAVFIPRLKFSVNASKPFITDTINQFVEKIDYLNYKFFYTFTDYCCFKEDLDSDIVDLLGSRPKISSVKFSIEDVAYFYPLKEPWFDNYIDTFDSDDLGRKFINNFD